ncbi:hypothetical protein KPH14_009734 [Odynerus spinipes]|uniref:Uncharacterized protein n=1 Tax=Odynerus spinipes TaxID=1348599 RepID=A0AAD9REV6_9HYME|nr:hypothetical protein KPH14_009734 [Odynerus spinipes]
MNHENETENLILKNELREVKNNFTQAVAQINVMQRKLEEQQHLLQQQQQQLQSQQQQLQSQQQQQQQQKQEQQQQPEQQEETTRNYRGKKMVAEVTLIKESAPTYAAVVSSPPLQPPSPQAATTTASFNDFAERVIAVIEAWWRGRRGRGGRGRGCGGRGRGGRDRGRGRSRTFNIFYFD